MPRSTHYPNLGPPAHASYRDSNQIEIRYGAPLDFDDRLAKAADLMKPDGPFKHFVVAFLLALVLYIAFYRWDRHLRLANGPWEVTFQAGKAGDPAIIVNQKKLGISNLKIVFAGETGAVRRLEQTVVFDSPLKPVPFGRVVFHDLMYLPGTIVLDCFGHEVELLPRVLVVNRSERPWRSESKIELSAPEKLSQTATNKVAR